MVLDSPFGARLHSSANRCFELLQDFSKAKVLVVGDLTLDEFLTGQVERLSREAPVLIIRHETTKQVPGGGANTIYNLAKLGARVKVAGFTGKDDQGKALVGIFEEAGVDTAGILIDPERPTVTKTRISAHARQSVTQQVVRVDRKSDELPSEALRSQLAEYIRQQLPTVDLVVCSDYGDGTLTKPVIEAALEHNLTIVDAQKDLQRYRGATLFTPNLPEAELAAGYKIANAQSLSRAGRDLLELTQAEYILVTRGEEGMSLFDRSGKEDSIPAFNKTDVFDVTGAGDTVVAAIALALSAGGSFWEAAVLGNLAASIVVRQFGTSTTNPEEMKEALNAFLND